MTNPAASTDLRSKADHVFGLDVFRAFAIIFVLIGHTFEHSVLPPSFQTLGHLGIIGVELFFVLSGFLIGSIIMRLIDQQKFQSPADIFTFWKRRWLRTLPLYIVVLLAFLRFDYHGRHGLLDYPAYYVFFQSFSTKIPEFFELSWSLAIEEHFYLWFPLVFLVWRKRVRRVGVAILASALTFIAIAYAFRFSQPLFNEWNEYNRTVRVMVLSRLDAIMFGVIVASLKHYWSAAFQLIKRVTPISAIAFVLICTWWFVDAPHLMQSRFLQINLFTLQGFLCALLLPWFDGWRTQKSSSSFFTVTSRLSYSLYLVHILVIIFVNRTLVYLGFFDQIYKNPLIIYPIYLSMYYLVSWVTYHRIEKPFLLLRDIEINVVSVAKASWFTVALCLLFISVF